jgi:hypothetical protein
MPWNTFPESMTVVSPVLKSPLADRLAFPQSQQGLKDGEMKWWGHRGSRVL